MKNPLISVLITTYNAQETVVETLNSIAAQTYSKYEIVIVDDGSEDGTVSIVKGWQRDNKKVQLNLYEPGRLGRAKALNFGVKKSRGEWIAICDADDLWHPKKLELQTDILYIRKNIAILATDNKILNKKRNNKIFKINNYDKIVISKNINDFLYKNSICHSSALIKKERCIYNSKLKKLIDLDLWLRILDKGNKINILKIPLTYKRLHDDQKFGTNSNFSYRFKAFKLRLPYIYKYSKYYLLPFAIGKILIGIFPKRVRSIFSSFKER